MKVMAISEDILIGGFKGRVGNMVVYQLYGKTVMRTLPSVKPKKATGAKKRNQDDFAQVMFPLRKVTAFIRQGFYHMARGCSPFNAAISANVRCFREAGRPDGIQWLVLSDGTRAGAELLTVQTDFIQSTAQISWGQPETGKLSKLTDCVWAIAINARNFNMTREIEEVKRSEGKLIINLPEGDQGDEIHYFVSFFDHFYPGSKMNPS